MSQAVAESIEVGSSTSEYLHSLVAIVVLYSYTISRSKLSFEVSSGHFLHFCNVEKSVAVLYGMFENSCTPTHF